MSKPKKIICYDDNPDYGGHQIMAALAVEHLARASDWQPVFFCNPRNSRLLKHLQAISASTGNLAIRKTPFATRKLQGLRNHFSLLAILRLRHMIASQRADLLLCIQGEIEDGSLALCAAEQMKLPCISYIPIPHRMQLMGAKFGAIRDRLNAYLFRKPNGWITISESMKILLKERGTTSSIEVVHNGIETDRFTPLDQGSARTALGVPRKKILLGTVGRIEFNQKQQDFLVRTFADYWKQNPSLHLVITGDGPDRKALNSLIDELGLQDRVSMLPWQKDSALVYSALDVLIIPSRFEGVPLVMLEALACGTPVVASSRDGMQDLLPPEWLFEPENAEALATAFDYVSRHCDKKLPAMQKKIRTEHTILNFQNAFEQALTRFLEKSR